MSNSVKFKIVILGTEGVGKTCLLNRFINDKFSDNYQTVSIIVRLSIHFSSKSPLHYTSIDVIFKEKKSLCSKLSSFQKFTHYENTKSNNTYAYWASC